jgi:hypothetical protein
VDFHLPEVAFQLPTPFPEKGRRKTDAGDLADCDFELHLEIRGVKSVLVKLDTFNATQIFWLDSSVLRDSARFGSIWTSGR